MASNALIALGLFLIVAFEGLPLHAQSEAVIAGQWPIQKAANWQRANPWLVGCNFITSSAINQLEMWQADTFDPSRIDRELGWAEGLGFNSVRVFLHNLLWTRDSQGFLKRIDQFMDAPSTWLGRLVALLTRI
jgi:hypothetical protein